MPFKFHKKFFLNASLSEKAHVFFSISTFPQTTSLSNTKKSVMRGRAFIGLALRNIPRNHGGIAYPPNPRRSFGRSIQREITNDPYIRAGAYAPLHGFACNANPPSDAGWLRSSTVGFAEPFRSVCRNVSGKLPSHPFAALTGLAAAPRGLLVSYIMSWSFATAFVFFSKFGKSNYLSLFSSSFLASISFMRARSATDILLTTRPSSRSLVSFFAKSR